MKSEVASLLVKVRANAWVLVLAPLLAVEDVMVIELSKALGVYLLAQDRGTRIQEWFDGWFTSLDAMGTPVLLSRSARLFFERNQDPGLRAFWNDHLQRNYRLVPERRQGFAGTWVRAPN